MINKIQPFHQQKPAYVYLRQSTTGQLRLNPQSTERQYALKDKALAMGWKEHQIFILDQDLGLSGSQAHDREDFKTLVADVSMNKVGAVFALEASRLSRSNADWHRLLELCALTSTLLIDEDGCYDPSDFNDQLLLGLKGTMSQAELHFIRARLLGGKQNKARKGELHFPLPVGFCYDEMGRTIQDPNEEVRHAVELLFRAFSETGSAYGVAHYFAKHNLKFPKRSYGGSWDGKLVWGTLSDSRILGVLKNPAYAGAYVYGRYHCEKVMSEDGRIRLRPYCSSMDKWQVLLKEHHHAYISWDEYMTNQGILQSNQTNGKDNLLPTSAREGLAMLQGLLLCGLCGHRLTVRYKGNNGVYPCYQCGWKKRSGLAKKECLNFKCDWIDGPLTRRILDVVTPAQIEISMKALEDLEGRQNMLKKHWEMKIQRAQYEADLAQRRYEQVDPTNRLVASSLEHRWNAALEELAKTRTEYDEHLKKIAVPHIALQKSLLAELTKDFSRLWNAPSTKAKDRKRIIRLLIKDITITREHRTLHLQIRWQGGATEHMECMVQPKAHEVWQHSPETIETVRKLSLKMDDQQIAETLNQKGLKTNKGNPFTVASIKWIRYKFKIPAPSFKRSAECTVQEIANEFGVSIHVVYYWIDRGIVKARKVSQGHPWYIALNSRTKKALHDWVKNSNHIKGLKISQKHTAGGAL